MAQLVLSVYFFFLCVSFGFWYFGNELEAYGILNANDNRILGRSLDFDELANNYNSTSQQYAGGAGFNPAFIFGDFGKGATEFMNIITGKYVIVMLTKIGFPSSFIVGMQVTVVGFAVVGALIYYISGRQ